LVGVEILRFGPGFRRPTPMDGSRGLAHQTIWSDARARVTELSFSRRALIGPQSSPDHGLFIVIAGGGWVQVGEERSVINHGEAVEWPPGVGHGAWTDGSTMRAILVETPARAMDEAAGVTAEAHVTEATPARGRLAEREVRPDEHDTSQGEPW
jgi:quercetin dioxygenase-like cupin family protein